MGMEAEPLRATDPELVLSVVKFVGGTTAVTKVQGRNATVTYNTTGRVDIKWNEAQGSYVDLLGFSLHATTPAALKNYSITVGDYSATTRTVSVFIFSSAGAAVDLAALQWLTLTFAFARAGAGV